MSNYKPVRTCIACRKEFEKQNLLRIVRTPDGHFEVDKTGKLSGRGAYICGGADCIKKLKKGKLLNRVFKCEISDAVYNAIEETFVGKQE